MKTNLVVLLFSAIVSALLLWPADSTPENKLNPAWDPSWPPRSTPADTVFAKDSVIYCGTKFHRSELDHIEVFGISQEQFERVLLEIIYSSDSSDKHDR